MSTKVVITYKSGREIQFVDKPSGGPGSSGSRMRSAFESFLKTGKQTDHVFSFRDRTDNIANPNILYSVDFKDLSSIVEYDI